MQYAKQLGLSSRLCRCSGALGLLLMLTACGRDQQAQETPNIGVGTSLEAIIPSVDDTTGVGELRLQLGKEALEVVPSTYCSGQEAIYTVVGKQGDVQIDMRVLEHPTMRGDKPLEAVTDVALQRGGKEGGRTYQDVWTSKSVERVERDGATTRVSGQMEGIRMHANTDGTFASPVPIDQGATRTFSLEARCQPA